MLEYCLRAIFAPPKYDTYSLHQYAALLEACHDYEAAEVRQTLTRQDYYLQSLEANPNNPEALLDYGRIQHSHAGNFLSQVRGDDEYAERFYTRLSQNTAGQGKIDFDLDDMKEKYKNPQWWSSLAKIQ